MESISSELDISFHVPTSQLSGRCGVISNRLWGHQQNVTRATHKVNVRRSSLLSPFMDSLYRVINEIMNVSSWQTVYARPPPSRMLFWCYFLHCCATGGIDKKKQFAAYIYGMCVSINNVYSWTIFAGGIPIISTCTELTVCILYALWYLISS